MTNDEPRAESTRVEKENESAVREIEHTADLGMEVEADTLPELFARAAFGTMELVRGDEDGDVSADGDSSARRSGGERRSVAIDLPKDDLGTLLVRWLRELLYLQEVDGFVYGQADFERLDASGLRALVTARTDPEPPIRELKGVTYHGLEVERTDDGWRARVIFDI